MRTQVTLGPSQDPVIRFAKLRTATLDASSPKTEPLSAADSSISKPKTFGDHLRNALRLLLLPFQPLIKLFRPVINLISNLLHLGKKVVKNQQEDTHSRNTQLNLLQTRLREMEELYAASHPPDSQEYKRGKAKRLDTLKDALKTWKQDKFELPNPTMPDPLAYKTRVPMPESVTLPKTTVTALNKATAQDIRNLAEGQSIRLKIEGDSTPRLMPRSEASIDPDTDMEAKIALQGKQVFSGENLNVPWSKEKCIRDIYQNGFDGHRGTLAGTDITVTRKNGKYVISINGKSQFDYLKIWHLGFGDKADDKTCAGGNSEGSKMLAFSLLKQHGAESVDYTSANWRVHLTWEKHPKKQINCLYKELRQVDYKEGNAVEITTGNADLVESLFKGVDYFYHPRNPDFDGATYKNTAGGFKFLPNGSGNLYHVKQRFEYKNNDGVSKWDNNLENLTLWTNYRDDLRDRDRTALDKHAVKDMIKEITEKMCNEALMKNIKVLEPLWKFEESRENQAGTMLLQSIISKAQRQGIATKFPANCFAYNKYDDPNGFLKKYMQEKGMKLCWNGFSSIGMPTAKDYWEATKVHNWIKPTPQDERLIAILKESAKILYENPQREIQIGGITAPLIVESDLKKNVLLFSKHQKQNPMDSGSGGSDHNAMWNEDYIAYAQESLRESSYHEGLARYIHELTHKHGGDGSEPFSYALSNWNGQFTATLIDGESRIKRLRDLRDLWEETTAQLKAKPTASVAEATKLDKVA